MLHFKDLNGLEKNMPDLFTAFRKLWWDLWYHLTWGVSPGTEMNLVKREGRSIVYRYSYGDLDLKIVYVLHKNNPDVVNWIDFYDNKTGIKFGTMEVRYNSEWLVDRLKWYNLSMQVKQAIYPKFSLIDPNTMNVVEAVSASKLNALNIRILTMLGTDFGSEYLFEYNSDHFISKVTINYGVSGMIELMPSYNSQGFVTRIDLKLDGELKGYFLVGYNPNGTVGRYTWYHSSTPLPGYSLNRPSASNPVVSEFNQVNNNFLNHHIGSRVGAVIRADHVFFYDTEGKVTRSEARLFGYYLRVDFDYGSRNVVRAYYKRNTEQKAQCYFDFATDYTLLNVFWQQITY